MKNLRLFVLLAFFWCVPALAAPQPVEISAAKSLEWNRKEKTYTARQDVVATQGGVSLRSDTLVARYKAGDAAADITKLEARDHVVIQASPYTAYGDRALYDVKTGQATLTGGNLKITMNDDVLTARDKIEFFNNENRLVAVGNATATHENGVITADTMSATFIRNAAGKTQADKVTAEGNVTLKTAKETATGDRGVYDVASQKAVLTGRVRILQGENWLEGTRADVDMRTGISRLSGSGNAATEGRVKGVFYPKAGTPGKN